MRRAAEKGGIDVSAYMIDRFVQECFVFEMTDEEKGAIKEEFKTHRWQHDPRLDPQEVAPARTVEVTRLVRCDSF